MKAAWQDFLLNQLNDRINNGDSLSKYPAHKTVERVIEYSDETALLLAF